MALINICQSHISQNLHPDMEHKCSICYPGVGLYKSPWISRKNDRWSSGHLLSWVNRYLNEIIKNDFDLTIFVQFSRAQPSTRQLYFWHIDVWRGQLDEALPNDSWTYGIHQNEIFTTFGHEHQYFREKKTFCTR